MLSVQKARSAIRRTVSEVKERVMNTDEKTVPGESVDEGLGEVAVRPSAVEMLVPEAPAPEGEEGNEAGEAAAAIPRELSILPLRDNVLFPAVVAPLTVTREASVKLIDDAAVAESRVIGIVTLRDPTVENPTFEDLYPVGVAAAIRMMVKMPEGVRLIVHGLQRIRLIEPTQEEPYIRCSIEPI